MIVFRHDCVGAARRRHRISLLCVPYFSASIWLNFCVCRNCLNHLIIYAFKSLGAGFVAWKLVLGIYTAWFEVLYAEAQGDATQIAWAKLAPHPYLQDMS